MNHVKHVIPMSDSSVSIKPEDIQPTVLPDAFIQSEIVRKLNTLSLPRYDQLGNVEKVGVAPEPKRVGPASQNLEYG